MTEKNPNPCGYVLLVEDDEDLRVQMAQVLRDEGYRVETAANGKIAFDYLSSCAADALPGCIILDLMMPVMTGGEFLRKISEPGSGPLGAIPILVATAKGSPKAELVGLPDHIGRIRKPMDLEEFLAAVYAHCGEPSGFGGSGSGGGGEIGG